MAIPVSHLWMQRTTDLKGLREVASSAAFFAELPLFRRRVHMHRACCPRHLYKYRAVPSEEGERRHFASILLNNQLWAASPANLNDPFDSSAAYRVDEQGSLLRSAVARFFMREGAEEDLAKALALDECLEDASSLSRSLEDGHRKLLSQIGICSLAGDPRSTLLWSHYAQNHCGVAIQYRPCLDPEALQLFQVQYSESLPVINNYFDKDARDLLAPLLTKSKPWGYEKEWRVIRAGKPDQLFSVRPEALTGVLLGMRISPQDREYVMALAAQRDEHFGTLTSVYQTIPATGTNELKVLRVNRLV